MDVLLVNAQKNEINLKVCDTLPLGLAYIGAVLREAGYDVSAIDFNVAPVDSAQITQIIERASPPILAISTNTATHLNGLTFARLAKEVNPEIKVVIGGPHASVLYEEVAMEKGVDVVARGEGEYTMLNLGMYPALILEGETPITVEVYDVDEDVFQSLDWLEGYPNYYNRKLINTQAGEAWIYFLDCGEELTNNCVTSGDWTQCADAR